MAQVIIQREIERAEKLAQMQNDAAFDVADNDSACVPDLSFLRDEIRGKPAPPKVPKVFVTNNCIFNCAYCGCRCSRDKPRYENSPREMAEISVQAAKENGRGVFVTSAICKNADYTEELIIETIRIMREELEYRGYIHAKVMPGADPLLIREAGRYADRLSVNIEVAHSDGYRRIARNKSKQNILTPMGQISEMIRAAKEEKSFRKPAFATSQTTQMMAGSTEEDDHTILRLSGALYKKYRLKRVYYTAFQYRDPALGYEELPFVATPKWRMHRLYQADRLMQLYGFTEDDIAPESAPFLPSDIDPKAAWALRNLHLFPVEINTADYEMLIRVPGIGITYAQRILKARKYCKVTHDTLRTIGVSLKRSRHFITCAGRYQGGFREDEAVLRSLLTDPNAAPPAEQLMLDLWGIAV